MQYIDLPAKIVGYSSNRVSVQYLQTSCGCSGGSQGTKLTYTYFLSGTDAAAKIVESAWGGSSFAAYRNQYYDLKTYSSVPYLLTYALEDAATTSSKWVWHYVYDTNQNLVKTMYPSALDSYTPASTSAAVLLP